MKKHLLFLTLILTAGFFSTGCPSTSTLHTARPVTPGDYEITVNPNVTGLYAYTGGGNSDDTDFDSVNLVGPAVEGQFRYGITDGMDFGIKLSTYGHLRFDYNWAPILWENFVLSVNPSFSFVYFATGGDGVFIGFLDVGLLADVISTEFATLTLGIKPGTMIFAGTFETENENGRNDRDAVHTAVFTLGGSIGARFQVSQNLALLPEFSFLWSTSNDQVNGLLLYTAGLGFVF